MEKDQLYEIIMEGLRKPFPSGTLQSRNNNPNKKYIPSQSYEERLEEIAKMYWSWEIKGEPIIYEQANEVQVIGTLSVLDARRDGIGFANFERYEGGKVKNLRYAIRSAAQDALRDACDHFQMGWIDLGKTSDSASSNTNTLATSNGTSRESIPCIKCKSPLTKEDLEWLNEKKVKLKFCKSCIPSHLAKKS